MSGFTSPFHFRIIFLIDITLLLCVQVLQGGVLDFFFIHQIEGFEGLWTSILLFLLDFFCFCFFLIAAIISYKYFTYIRDASEVDGKLQKKFMYLRNLHFGVLPLSYISWILYTVILVGKLSIIYMFENISNLNKGLAALQICLGMSSIIFMLLVEGHNWHKKSSLSYSYVIDICKKIGIEIFDSVEMLEFLFKYDDMSQMMKYGVFSLVCTNFFLPSFSLYRLSISCFGMKVTPLCSLIKILHDLLRVSMIDIPFFIVRLRMLIVHQELSIFMVKNLFYILMAVRELYLDLYIFFKPLPQKRENAEEYPLNDDATQTDSKM